LRLERNLGDKKYFPELDGLRGCAVIMVMLFHLGGSVPHNAWGKTGVDLFLVLSGFLITGILIDTRECSNRFLSFYARRAIRIFPVFYGTLLLVLFALNAINPGEPIVPPHADWKYYFLFMTNWTALLVNENSGIVHFWSLGLEEQFYVVWPLIVFTVAPRSLKWWAVALIAIAVGVRASLFGHISQSALYRCTFSRTDALAIGALCAIAIRDARARLIIQRFARWFVPAALLIFLSVNLASRPNLHDGRNMLSWGLTAVAIGYALIMLAGVLGVRPFARVLMIPALRRFGRYSYGMYVFHVPLFHLLDRVGLAPGLALVALKLAAAFSAAALSFELIEAPIGRLKDRFRPRFPPFSLEGREVNIECRSLAN
jgi:peptidoglycan/LPS O-acetylase OafA/YrhL